MQRGLSILWWRIFIIIGLIIVLVPSFVFSFITFNKYTLKNDVRKHLIDQGYMMNQIESIETYFGKVPVFSARVVFSDENNVTYYYMKDHNKIRQFGTPTGLGGNEIFDIDHLLHFEKR